MSSSRLTAFSGSNAPRPPVNSRPWWRYATSTWADSPPGRSTGWIGPGSSAASRSAWPVGNGTSEKSSSSGRSVRVRTTRNPAPPTRKSISTPPGSSRNSFRSRGRNGWSRSRARLFCVQGNSANIGSVCPTATPQAAPRSMAQGWPPSCVTVPDNRSGSKASVNFGVCRSITVCGFLGAVEAGQRTAFSSSTIRGGKSSWIVSQSTARSIFS